MKKKSLGICSWIVVFAMFAHAGHADSASKVAQPIGPQMPDYFKLDQMVQSEIARGGIVGVSVAVVERGEVTFKKGYGRRKKGEAGPIDTDTTFQLGSTSKPITATLFALAQKQGRISPETPVTIAHSGLVNTKVHHLLSHTTGKSRNGMNMQIEQGKSRAQLFEFFAKRKQTTPGLTYDYHNFAFSIIEDLLSAALNVPFDAALEQQLFKRLNMTRTTVGFARFNAQTNRAWPHEKLADGQCRSSSEYSHRYHDTVTSSGGINASINDMAQFLVLQLGHKPELLTAVELAPLHSMVVGAPDAQRWFKNKLKGEYSCHYGYGFRILKRSEQRIVFHGGWVKGFSSFFAFSPEKKRGIVILSNTESRFAMETAIRFLENEI